VVIEHSGLMGRKMDWYRILKIISFLLLPVMSYAGIKKVTTIDCFGSNAYLLETDSSLFLLDAGYPKYHEKIRKEIKNNNPQNKPLKLIILTHAHFDHYGSAQRLKELTGAKIAIHRLDSSDLHNAKTRIDRTNVSGFFGKTVLLPIGLLIFRPVKTPPDITFDNGFTFNEFGLDAKVIHTPGHTDGSSTIVVEDSLVFFGDLIVKSNNFSKQKYYAVSWEQIDSSINNVSTMHFKTGFIGHGSKTLDTLMMNRIVSEVKKLR
jgi:glyoxylase-like metal-dependent hydrolase (beta-lactamase superfamily II)